MNSSCYDDFHQFSYMKFFAIWGFFRLISGKISVKFLLVRRCAVFIKKLVILTCYKEALVRLRRVSTKKVLFQRRVALVT